MLFTVFGRSIQEKYLFKLARFQKLLEAEIARGSRVQYGSIGVFLYILDK